MVYAYAAMYAISFDRICLHLEWLADTRSLALTWYMLPLATGDYSSGRVSGRPWTWFSGS